MQAPIRCLIDGFRIARIGILPTSSFIFKDTAKHPAGVCVQCASKARIEMKIANEKAAEIAKMQETGAIKGDAIERALEGYEKARAV